MRLLTAKEVAPLLQVTSARVYELARERAIPVIRIGERQLRFDEAALRDWIAAGGRPLTQAVKEAERDAA